MLPNWGLPNWGQTPIKFLPSLLVARRAPFLAWPVQFVDGQAQAFVGSVDDAVRVA